MYEMTYLNWQAGKDRKNDVRRPRKMVIIARRREKETHSKAVQTRLLRIKNILETRDSVSCRYNDRKKRTQNRSNSCIRSFATHISEFWLLQ